MSVMSSTPLESPLSAPWDPPNTFPDIHTVMFGQPSFLLSHESQPQFWSKYQVWNWLLQILDMHQIDTSNIPLQNFDMDGQQLCSLSYQDFLLAAGSVGPILYHSLGELKWNGRNPNEIGQCDLKEDKDYLEPDTYPNSSHSSHEIYEPSVLPVLPPLSPVSSIPEIKRCNRRTYHVKKESARGTHLWEFVRDILLHPEHNPGLIKWEDRKEGVFRFLKSEAVAQLWGKRKNNSSMTYEKLSRAMRYYYKREILERVDGRRLVYKFGRNAKGWRD
ncbi:unnamed protein product [Knipowitschia caucasica]